MADDKKNDLYKIPAVRPATLGELSGISDDLGLNCTEDELKDFKDYMNHAFADTYQRVSEMIGPTLPVNYPRLPGHKPNREDNKYNAWYWKCDIKGAQEGILKGKTIAIKDNCCVAGVPMMNGASLMEGYIPEVDATIVSRILDAGNIPVNTEELSFEAVDDKLSELQTLTDTSSLILALCPGGNITGKANCEFMCFSGCSFSSSCGPVLNPHDTTRSAGGSSSGSAVLVQTGDVDMAIGGDQGGSIRIPSSSCGVVGLKPTWGLVPYTGAVPIEITMDHLGPIARTVEDCALLLEAIAGYDDGLCPRQPRDLIIHKYSKQLASDLKGKKIGLVKEGFAVCEKDVISVVKSATNKLTEAGAIVEEISIPMHADGIHIWGIACLEGAYKCMVQGNGYGYHWKGLYVESLQEALFRGYQCRKADMFDMVKYTSLYGEYVYRNYGNKFYAKSQNLIILLKRAYDKALDKYDVLVMPTLPSTAPKLPEKSMPLSDRLKLVATMTANTSPFDVSGHPALSINVGFSEGLPIGMMIVGKHFDETSVLQAAYAFEKLQNGQ